MAYIRKTVDRWDIETNYGYGGKSKIVNTPEQKQENAWKNIKKILVAGFLFG